ncbi:MAG TPA: chorismate-binding protein, partial [Candidatus Limnocylindrales bacterium]
MPSTPEARPDSRPLVTRREAPVPASSVRVRRLPALDGVAPMDAAEAFRDVPGLALLESARPGRMGRWTLLTADPVAVLEQAASAVDPFADARLMLARLAAGEAEVEADADDAEADDAEAGDAFADQAGDAEGGRADADDADDADEAKADGRRRPSALPPFLGGLVGYLGYDLGRRFERLPSIARADQPLPELRLALYDWAIAWDRRTGHAWLGGRALDGDAVRLGRRLAEVRERLASASARSASVTSTSTASAASTSSASSASFTAEAALSLVSGTSQAEWVERVEAIRTAIAEGEIYQANLTRRLETPFNEDPWPLFRRLRTGDPALFAGYIDLGRDPGTGSPRALLSASPEPFLSVDARGDVSTDPIKGTRQRGMTRDEDRALARELLASRKDQAENVMIVDVLRNDLGRVCLPGSVRVPRLLRLERSATVQHLVTTVTGRLAPGKDAFDLMAAAFPGGSITGAPKIRAMEVIERLEPVRRGPYCGTMLWLGADGRMGSSILIRTFVA